MDFLRANLVMTKILNRTMRATRRRLIRLMFIACAMFWVGCAARDVTPVAMSQPGDDALSCPVLIEQIKANRAEAEEFLREDTQTDRENVAKIAVGSLLAPIGLFLANSADLSHEDQVKARSIADRNEQLIFLAKRKKCAES
jgi:hypothetical protein